jgi:hypothetical protein
MNADVIQYLMTMKNDHDLRQPVKAASSNNFIIHTGNPLLF